MLIKIKQNLGTYTFEQTMLGISPDNANTNSCKQTSTNKSARADKVCKVINPCTHDNINTDYLSHPHKHKYCISIEILSYGLFGFRCNLNTLQCW